ncbi:MAG: cation:proton antiporter subunit C [Deltaproteobacteria bacterium]|nr:cation:proton antiporter subunit C [Deltaproteobacteria bacterium]MCL4873887.1 cation:proton antiporter subunit C [bacterium]
MTQWMAYSVCGLLLFTIGLYGTIAYGHVFRKVLSFNIMGSGIFLFLVSIAGRAPGHPDPVPHAMVLTGIVVTVSATAFALALLRKMNSETGEESLGPGQEYRSGKEGE